MYNLRSTSDDFEEFVPILIELNQLIHLDISDDTENSFGDCITKILECPQCFKNLRSLDLSGRDIDDEELKKFIIYKQQSSCESLKFLGLMNTTVCYEDLFSNECLQWCDSDFVITGNATESQIIESLLRYKHRPNFVEISLVNLYDYTLTYYESRMDLIDLIVTIMREHSEQVDIQMAATACLFCLTKDELSQNINSKKLTEVVNMILNAMELFPNHQQLHMNSILILCNNRILQDISFDRFKCCQLVMNYLVAFKDTHVTNYANYICLVLMPQISISDKSKLESQPVYMETLLDIVRMRVQFVLNDDYTLEYTLRVIASLSDESPKSCQIFIEKGGIDLYLFVLNVRFDF